MLPAIKIENLSKQYRLGVVGTGTLSHDLKRWWITNIRGKEDPYLKLGDANDRAHKGQGEYIWALKDICFEVEQGDILGIIGKNGAGKSTLLKILSKVTRPSIGTIKYRGRIASLLEVGTGFHPEMTGRENVYMNGAIMGMTKTEITRKFDEIVDFSGVERYIDTPVKRYSSGMTVRLGFAIAAHLEPEILVVDEVLAVGDAEFQKKAIGKMQEVSTGHGRTVLFVSHNMTAIQGICKSAILLGNGLLVDKGNVDTIVNRYLMAGNIGSLSMIWENEKLAPGNEIVKMLSYNIKSLDKLGAITVDSGLSIEFRFKSFVPKLNLGFTIYLINSQGILLFESGVVITSNKDSTVGEYRIYVEIPPHFLNSDRYNVKVVIGESQRYILASFDDFCGFEVEHTATGRDNNFSKAPGVVRPLLNWTAEFI